MGEKPTAEDEMTSRDVTNAPMRAFSAPRDNLVASEASAQRAVAGGQTDPTPAEARYVHQTNETDIDFLQKKADEKDKGEQ